MKKTVKDFCAEKGIGVRYIQRLLQENTDGRHSKLLKESWGITNAERIGRTYLLTVKKNNPK